MPSRNVKLIGLLLMVSTLACDNEKPVPHDPSNDNIQRRVFDGHEYYYRFWEGGFLTHSEACTNSNHKTNQ